MREENIYTNTGINSSAAKTLWELVKDDVKIRNRIISIIKIYKNYYKCISDIKNIQVRTHIARLIMQDGNKIDLSVSNPKIITYFRNVIRSLYKLCIEEIKEDRKGNKFYGKN